MEYNTVLKATRYSKFKLMGANRDVDQSHVNKLKASFDEFGNFTTARPILVNERMEVIDGQHRLEACKQLTQPVYYIIVPGLTVTEARAMNMTQKNWTPLDFAHSYASTGMQAYQDYLTLREEYPQASHNIILSYVSGYEVAGRNATFRKGEFVLDNIDEVRDRLDKYMELVETQPEFKQRGVGYALLQAMSVDTYDQDRMVEQVKRAGANFAAYQSTSDNLRMLENLYNKNRTTNRLRFF